MSRRLLVALCGFALLVSALLVGAAVFGTGVSDGDGQAKASATPSALDVGFLQDMIVHHQQAVTMSDFVRQGAGVEITSLADVLRGDQLLEIGQMTGLLQAWDKPLVSSTEPMTWMAGHGSGPMPGMATQDELNRLTELKGSAKEASFLQLMIRHHEGGLHMAQYAAEHSPTPQVKALAERVTVEQTKENRQMALMLEQRQK